MKNYKPVDRDGKFCPKCGEFNLYRVNSNRKCSKCGEVLSVEPKETLQPYELDGIIK